MQYGFMPGKGRFMVRISQNYGRKKRKFYLCFLDLEKYLIEYHGKRGVSERLVRAVMRLYDRAQTKVKVCNGMSDGFSLSWCRPTPRICAIAVFVCKCWLLDANM